VLTVPYTRHVRRDCRSITLTAGRSGQLVSRLVNSAAVGGEGFEDLVSGLGPHERLGVLVPLGDPLADVVLELGNAAVG